jgi:hypothetical protein
LRVPRSRWFADIVGAVILFLIFSYASNLILVPLAIMVAQSLAYGGGYIIYSLMSTLTSLFIAPIIFVVLVKGTFWRHEPAFVGVESVYGLHPNVAKIQVERGITLNEEEAQTVVWSVRDWEKRKRSSRRMGVCTLAAVAGWVVGIFLIAWIGYIPYGLYFSLMMYIPFIIASAAVLTSYLLLRRWDNNAMGEVFKKTTDYDEPIWMD